MAGAQRSSTASTGRPGALPALRALSRSWVRVLAWTMALGTLILFRDWLWEQRSVFLLVLTWVIQVMLMVGLAIVQFVAIFWFLGRARVYWIQPGETGITFADYRGNPDVLEISRRLVTLLRGVKRFREMGGELSRGLLLVGPPGTGKSYLAQAIANEAGVPFAYASAPSFRSMFFGISNLKIMNLYRIARKQARQHGACIVFIDEIDAIGRARSEQAGGMVGGLFGGDTGLLNELLLQLDPPNIDHSRLGRMLRRLGLRTRSAHQPAVFTIAATNLPESLDRALIRPGRLDRKVTVDLPDFEGRKDILQYYLGRVRHDPSLSLDTLAADTIRYSPAQIKFVVNEAVVYAHFAGRNTITYADFCAAREFHEWGLRQPIRALSQEDRRRIAYHEAGHCVAMYLLCPQAPPVKATIVRHTGFLGAVQAKPLRERYTTTRAELLAAIQVSLASRAAEELFLGTALTGIAGDLLHATAVATAFLGRFGMGKRLFASPTGERSDALRSEAEELLQEQYRAVRDLLQEHAAAVHATAAALMEREELNREEIRQIMDEAQAVPVEGVGG